MAEDDGVVIGCCALIPMESGTYELAKMAVSESHQGRGVGRMLMEGVIAARARRGRHGYSGNESRADTGDPALAESAGFVHVGRKESSDYERSDVCMEMML